MPRSPRMAMSGSTLATRGVIAAAAEAERRDMPVDEVVGEAHARADERIGRRELLRRGALAGAGLAVAGAFVARPARSDPMPTVAIVGAGLAGLRCADALWNDPSAPRIASTVYEADETHLGGRCWSLRGVFTDHVAEHGGAFINHDQWAMRDLVERLGLELEFVNGGSLRRGREVYRIDGQPYSRDEAQADWVAVGRDAFREAQHLAPWPQLFDQHTPAGRRLDHMSVPEWLDHAGIGSQTRFGRLLMSDAVSEYGGDPSDQSALNLISLLATGRHLELADYDERYHVLGGNDQIVDGLVAGLPRGSIRERHELVALARRGQGYRLTFIVDGCTQDVTADHVVLTLPFTALRKVDLSHAGLSPRKMRAIRTMGMGQNAKIHVELDHKTWPALGYDGSTYTDHDGFCVAWDDNVPSGPSGSPAILLGYPGGSTGRDLLTGDAHGPAPSADVDWFLQQIEHTFPGTQDAFTGVAYEDHWSRDQWHEGAYSYYRVGQYTGFSGVEARQQGGIHFAGEHTDVNQQGFLEGAVRSGARAAKEIRAQI